MRGRREKGEKKKGEEGVRMGRGGKERGKNRSGRRGKEGEKKGRMRVLLCFKL